MSKPKKSAQPASNYITTVRDGALGANIFRGNTADGHTYLYFELSRSWKSQSGTREGYSKKYYPRNVEAICNVAELAARWIEEHPEAADGPIREEVATEQPVQHQNGR
jgi:hypothetical protein